MENIEMLVHNLIQFKQEQPWLEFKVNNCSPEMIGEDISALANAATYHERDKAYLVWGVKDDTHEVVGTDFDPATYKYKQQELEGWLRVMLSSNAEFGFEKGFV